MQNGRRKGRGQVGRDRKKVPKEGWKEIRTERRDDRGKKKKTDRKEQMGNERKDGRMTERGQTVFVIFHAFI